MVKKSLGIIDVSIGVLIIVIAYLLFTHRGFYPIPIIDVVQFANDSKDYMAGRLPNSIQAFPANPILIGLLTPFMAGNYPRFEAGVLISVWSIIGLAVVTWLLFRKTLGRLAAVLCWLLVFFNPLVWIMGLDADSTPLFTLVIVMSIWLYSRGKLTGAYIVSGLSYFVRPEGILYFLSLVVVDLLTGRKKRLLKQRGLLAAGSIVAGLTVVIFFNNFSHHVSQGNEYLYEVVDRFDDLPTWRFLHELPNLMLGRPFDVYMNWFILQGFYLVVGWSIFQIWKLKIKPAMVLSVFVGAYTLLHLLFPAHDPRYYLPILIPLILIVSLAVQQTRWVVLGVFGLGCGILVSRYLIHIPDSLQESSSRKRWDYLMIAEWVNAHDLGDRTILVTHEWLMNYLNHNESVDYIDIHEYSDCDNFYCLVSEYQFDNNEPISFVIGSDVDDLILWERDCLTEVYKVTYRPTNEWIGLYDYDPVVCAELTENTKKTPL